MTYNVFGGTLNPAQPNPVFLYFEHWLIQQAWATALPVITVYYYYCYYHCYYYCNY